MLTLFCDNICHFYTNFHQRVPDKITVLLGRSFVPFLAWCPRFMPICPPLHPYAHASMAKN